MYKMEREAGIKTEGVQSTTTTTLSRQNLSYEIPDIEIIMPKNC